MVRQLPREKGNHLPLLSMIGSPHTPRHQSKYLIEHLTYEQFKFISEIAHNLLKGVIPLTDQAKQILKPYVKQIRAIGNIKHKPRKRRLAVSVASVKALIKTALPHVLLVFKGSRDKVGDKKE